MINRKMIIDELENRGYTAKPFCIIKNDVEVKGIRLITEEEMSPAFYTDDIIECAEENNNTVIDIVDEMVKTIHKKMESIKKMQVSPDEIFDRNYVLGHVLIGLQKISNEKIVKRNYDMLNGIEGYLYVKKNIDQTMLCTIKITKTMLDMCHINVSEIWKYAQENTEKESVLISMKTYLQKQNIEYPGEVDDEFPLHLLTNKSFHKGASAILNTEVLCKFAEMYNTNTIVAFPSSIHEFIILPYSEDMDIEFFNWMVKDINRRQVSPKERLVDHVFVINLENHCPKRMDIAGRPFLI